MNIIINNILKDEYYDATHICYAYILENSQKAYDDNEPKSSLNYAVQAINLF